MAEAKATKIAQQSPDAVVLAADSVVSVNGLILGKPEDESDARTMLSTLSGTTHQVFTGHCIVANREPIVHVEKTDVTFRPLGTSEIDAYILSGEYKGKAGACSIQGYGAAFVESINGSYSNVVGLGLSWTAERFAELGVNYLSTWSGSQP